MTKRLILIRHAKSSWADPGMLDHDRPLNRRGHRSAIAIGTWLRETGYEPDRILCSTAARTRETCALLALDAEVEYLSALYHAGPELMLAQLQAAKGECVAMIGHNPGIGELATQLVQSPPPHGRFSDYPTGATMVADFDIEDWSQAQFGTARLINFITPRELTGD